jgi:hypothetical protein
MSMLRSPLRVLALLALAVLGVGLTSALTAAAASPLGLSWDGRTWSTSLSGRLFDGPRLMVPGDSATGRFFVRNMSSDAAMLRVQYRLPPSPLIGRQAVQVAVRVGSDAWTTLTTSDSFLPVTTTSLDQGSMVAVRVRATFNPNAGNSLKSLMEPITFRVTLTESVPGPGTTSTTPSSSAPTSGAGSTATTHGTTGAAAPTGGGGLAFTGVEALGLLLVAGAALVGAGLALLTGGRLLRRRGEHRG